MTQVLDSGYLELVEAWGSEEQIIEAARMSTGKGFLGWGERCGVCGLEGADVPCLHGKGKAGDEKLLRYLWEHKHHSPFEMAGMTFEVKAPIFVFREWHRHRVPFGYNEMSARYTPLPDENYVPSIDRIMRRGPGFSSTSKQAGVVKGAGTDFVDEAGAEIYQTRLREMYRQQEAFYQTALKNGVPKELARIHLPVGRYSRMRATGNLRGWLGFLALRMAPDAQWEIRQYANAACTLLQEAFPRTVALFKEGRPA